MDDYERINEWRYERHKVDVQLRSARTLLEKAENEERYAILDAMKSGLPSGAFTQVYRDEIEELRTTIRRLEREWLRRSICQELADRYGLELHDLLQMLYPFNHATQVIEVRLAGATEYHYVIPPKSQPIRDWLNAGKPPVLDTELEHGTCRFVDYGYRSLRVRIGYAPEINTLFLPRYEG